MRFAAKRFPYTGMFLDIGSGEGANARELALRGNRVFSIDKDPNVEPPLEGFPAWHHTGDVCFEPSFGRSFDLIYDINTLCHVEDPPLERIKNWLKPSGVFFSICPQFGSCSRVMEGKDFTRFLPMKDVEKFYGAFSDVKVGSTTYRLPGDKMYASWIVEGRP